MIYSEKAKNVINNISLLENNWNLNGALKIPDKVIKRSYELLELLKEQPFIFPIADEKIQFEYEYYKNEKEYYIEVNISIDTFEIYQEIESIDYEFDLVNINEVADILNDFSSKYK